MPFCVFRLGASYELTECECGTEIFQSAREVPLGEEDISDFVLAHRQITFPKAILRMQSYKALHDFIGGSKILQRRRQVPVSTMLLPALLMALRRIPVGLWVFWRGLVGIEGHLGGTQFHQ